MAKNINSKKRPTGTEQAGTGRRPIKVTPRRKTVIDPQMISLVYFLIASRIVREAEDKAAPESTVADEAVRPDQGGLKGRS